MSLMALMTGLGTPPALITYLFDVGTGSGGGGGGSAVRLKGWSWELFQGGGDVRVTLQAQIGSERPIERRYFTEGDTGVEIIYVPETSNGGLYPIAEDASVTFVMRAEGSDPEDDPAINTVGSVTLFRDADGTLRRAVLFTFDDDNPMPAADRYNAYFVVDGTALPLGKTIPITSQASLA